MTNNLTTTIDQDAMDLQKAFDDTPIEFNNDSQDNIPAISQSMEISLAPKRDINVENILTLANKRIEVINKITILCMKVTNAQDWQDMGGKPYLNASGCKKIARLFGVSYNIIDTQKLKSSDDLGEFYMYKFTGRFMLRNATDINDVVEEVGTKSSRNQFFAKAGGQLKPSSEVDETNIMKAAYTNCIARGIKALLGMDTLSWENLQQAWKQSGQKVEAVNKVSYGSGGKGGGAISDAQKKRLFAICKQNNVSNEQMKEYLKANYKIESSSDIGWKDYQAICSWAESSK